MLNHANRTSEILIGGLFVATAALLHLKFMGSAIMGLNLGLIIAYFVWVFSTNEPTSAPRKLAHLYLAGIVVQCLHATEEYLMDFHVLFPGLFGYRWTGRLFIVFNLSWLLLFVWSYWGVRRKIRLAYLVVWFFALVGGIGNGIVHPVLSILEGGYFPGLITSVAGLVLGILLVKELSRTSKVRKDELAV